MTLKAEFYHERPNLPGQSMRKRKCEYVRYLLNKITIWAKSSYKLLNNINFNNFLQRLGDGVLKTSIFNFYFISV